MRYDRTQLIYVYLAAHAGAGSRFGDYLVECDEYNDVLRRYYRGLLTALEKVFGLELDRARAKDFDARVYLLLFQKTADSCLAARTPWSGFLEGGLIIKRLEEAGAPGRRVLEASDLIEQLRAKSRAAHLEALDGIVEILLGDEAGLVFDSADVLAAGFDDAARPKPADYPSL